MSWERLTLNEAYPDYKSANRLGGLTVYYYSSRGIYSIWGGGDIINVHLPKDASNRLKEVVHDLMGS